MKTLLLGVLVWLLCAPLLAEDNFAERMMHSTFKLFNSASTSTCFVVAVSEPAEQRFLVTTAHTLETMQGENAVLVLRRPTGKGDYERVDFPIAIRRDGQDLWRRHKEQDVAALLLPDELPVELEAIPFEALADSERLRDADLHVCDRLYLFTYPERLESTSAGLPIARQGIFASPPTLASKMQPTFIADFTTFAGDSGGPVFVEAEVGEYKPSKPLIVGVVVGQHQQEEKFESKYESRQVKRAMGLGIVLHAMFLREILQVP